MTQQQLNEIRGLYFEDGEPPPFLEWIKDYVESVQIAIPALLDEIERLQKQEETFIESVRDVCSYCKHGYACAPNVDDFTDGECKGWEFDFERFGGDNNGGDDSER